MALRDSEAQPSKRKETATVGGGCFWCTEAVFGQLKGVEKVEPGYCGGKLANPTYAQVATGTTGHAEVVQITFDPEVISFKEVLEVFFATHNPTTLNRQGPDLGTQYRSVIFPHNDQQEKIAKELIEDLTQADVWSDPIVTTIEPFTAFYKAESYHMDYFKRHPNQPYCQRMIPPKLAKLRKHFSSNLKKM
ncbi:MAG: peptide-methionine (S)-S-oxide reductase MsrA [Candidatus Bathyarchaeota archaeon]|nr:MAG: peptide-methionine (S)-S-oxide reductase MsrA [Candidatus Bathyarchaeota archaeon]